MRFLDLNTKRLASIPIPPLYVLGLLIKDASLIQVFVVGFFVFL